MLAFMPDSPLEARFLHGNDKAIAIERLRANQMGVVSREWRNDHVKEALLDPKTWLWFGLIICISIPSGGIVTFGPLIISTFGFDKFQTILFNMPYGVIQIISTIGGAAFANRIKKKGPVIAFLCVPPILGCIVLLSYPHSEAHQVQLLAGYYLVSVYPGISKSLFVHS